VLVPPALVIDAPALKLVVPLGANHTRFAASAVQPPAPGTPPLISDEVTCSPEHAGRAASKPTTITVTELPCGSALMSAAQATTAFSIIVR
jgi:hypothetical protein